MTERYRYPNGSLAKYLRGECPVTKSVIKAKEGLSAGAFTNEVGHAGRRWRVRLPDPVSEDATVAKYVGGFPFGEIITLNIARDFRVSALSGLVDPQGEDFVYTNT